MNTEVDKKYAGEVSLLLTWGAIKAQLSQDNKKFYWLLFF